MKLNIIYTRISVSSTTKGEGESLKSQFHRCRERLIYLKVDQTTILHLEDDGYSGGNLERPHLQMLLKLVKAGQVDRVCVTEVSRLSRDNYEFQFVLKTLADHGVDLVMLDFDQDPQTSQGRFWLQMKSALATHERDLVVERSKRAAHSRASRGLWDGAKPFGYKGVQFQPGRLEVDQEAAETVKLIYHLYLTLGSVRSVQEKLVDLAVYRPERLNHKGELIPQGTFSDSTLRKILKSRVYIGEREYKACNKDLDQGSLKLCDRHLITQGQWEPIIERAVWDRVQDRLAFNSARRNSTAHIKHKRFILLGLLACGECGELLNSDSAKGNKYFYYCHPSATCTCSVKRWSASSLEGPFLKAMISLYQDQGLLEQACQRLNEQERVKRKDTPQRARALEASIKRLKRNRAQLLFVIKEQPELVKTYQEEISQNASELAQKGDELKLLRRKLKEPTVNSADVSKATELLKQGSDHLLTFDPYLLRQLFLYTISRVDVYGHDELVLVLRETPLLIMKAG